MPEVRRKNTPPESDRPVAGRVPLAVALDLSCAAKPRPSGIAHYARHLVEALARVSTDETFRLLYRPSRLKHWRHRVPAPDRRFGSGWLLESLPRLSLRGAALIHGLDARLPAWPVPRVATVHDLFSALRTDLATSAFRQAKLDRYAMIAAQATRIIVPSRGTRDDLERLYPGCRGKVRVVPHGIDPAFRPRSPEQVRGCLERLGVRQPYLFFVGLLSVRKNCLRIVRAFDSLAGDHPDLHLVLGGSPSHGFEEVAGAIRQARHGDRIILPGYIELSDLPDLYSGAEQFVFPTLREGFGLPIIEAMACGTPVLASAQTVPREVGGPWPLYVDPESEEAIVEGMRRLLAEGPRTPRTREGRRWVEQYTWERSARATLATYREAFDESH